MTALSTDVESVIGPATDGRSLYVTALIDDQMFGVPIEQVHDVFSISMLTPVPLAPPEVAGLLNLRGRLVTAIDLRRRLGLPGVADPEGRMAIGLELGPESFGLIVDQVGEIVAAATADIEPNPIHLGSRWAEISHGIQVVDDRLLIVLNVEAVLAIGAAAAAPAHWN